MQSSESRLIRILETLRDSLREELGRSKEEVMLYERRLNNELATNKSYVPKPVAKVQKKDDQVKQEMELKMEALITKFNSQVNEVVQVKKQPEKGSIDAKGKVPAIKRESSTVKHTVEQPKKPTNPPQNIIQHKPKVQVVQLASFRKPLNEIPFKNQGGKRINIKQYIQQYKQEAIKNTQGQRNARQGFLKALSKYTPSRNKILGEYTDKVSVRGWKGCKYSSDFLKYLSSLNKQDMLRSLNPKSKISEVYQWCFIGRKLRQNWEILKDVKSTIKAPKRLNIKLDFIPPPKQIVQKQAVSKLEIDTSLEQFYSEAQDILQNFIKKQSLLKYDLKLLVEICNVALTKGKKCFTVIKYDNLEQMISIIQQGPQRYNNRDD